MKKMIVATGLAMALASCYSVKNSVKRSYPNSQKINWPEAFIPEESRFFVHNEIDINASPEAVWNTLIHAEAWEEYYEGASCVVLIDNNTGKLEKNAVFSWNTMGLDFTSTVEEFEAPYRLSWESTRKSIRGYHAWLIIPTETGSKLITSEAQHGFLTLLQKVFVPNKLKGLHDEWLAQIKLKSENSQK